MSKTWPFENEADPKRRIRNPEDVLAEWGRDGLEAVVVRIGLNDAQLVLIDGRGDWTRFVYHSMDEARRVAEGLGIPMHEGEYPEDVRVRMNAFRRGSDSFEDLPYPEQGRVGPVIPYPENRPRRRVAGKEAAAPTRRPAGG